MKRLLLSGILLVALMACEKNVQPPDNPDPKDPNPSIVSEMGYLQYLGMVKMAEGPHDLLISNNHLYAVRDYRILQFQLNDPTAPSLTKEYSLGGGASFGNLYAGNNLIYAPCKSDGFIYVFNQNLDLNKKYELGISNFKPNVLIQDANGYFWIGGSNGTYGILAKYSFSNDAFNLLDSWTASYNNSNVESIIEKDNTVIASIAKGDLIAFDKNTINTGPVKTLTYTEEPGHGKWGYTLCKVNNKAYWANWGAGIATIDIVNPALMTVEKVLTNSLFKSQFSIAEGTNAYDIAYNEKHQVLCVANGWSGVLLVRPESSDKVYDFIDPTYFQNRSIATNGDYIYTGNISGGMSGDLKGIQVFKFK